MKTKRKRSQSPETLALKIELVRRELGAEDLARMIGTTPKVCWNVIAGRNRCAPMRRRIEDALQIPFWSSLDEFLSRRATRRPAAVKPSAHA